MRKTIVTSEVIVLGRQGEDGANKVLFPVRGWKELYGDGQFVVTALRPDENDPYPVTTHIYEEDDPNVTRRGVFVEWIVGSADVEIPGRGKVELAYYTSDDVRVKSVVYHTVIYDSLGQNSLTPPEPWESWVEDVREAGADAIQAAEDAAASAEGAAQSADDAAASAEEAAGAVSTAFSQITATATTLSPGSSATASFNPSTKVMHFGIPKGDPGSGGGGGADLFVAEFGNYTEHPTTLAEIRAAVAAGKVVYAKYDSAGYYAPLAFVNENGATFITYGPDHDDPLEYAELCVVICSGVDSWSILQPSYEKKGKLSVGSNTYSITRKALAITENGVTTTYYVADIT